MATIGGLFKSDVTRRIEEVIKVDQTDEDVIAGEIDEYVATESIKRRFLEVLERYQETPQKPHEGAAVWVSGFFGSGKSSFAKLLGLALENRPIMGTPAGQRFAERVGDNKLSVVLKTIGEQIPTHAVIFDVSTDRGIRTNQMLTEIMYRLFLESLGYAKDVDLAELEINLETVGKLDAFEAAYVAEYGKAWRQERGLLAFASSQASLIMHRLDPVTYPMADSWAKGRVRPNLTAGVFAERVVELMDRRKPGHSLVFVIDEVGQFVARDVQKMLDLQGIVQSLGRLGKGRFWTVVTSQEKLSELVSGLDDRKIELGRLMDRFPMQVHLEPSDISEVTSRRVLLKDAAAETVLGKLYEDNRARLNQNTNITASVRLPALTREQFVDLYPLLPYQIDLIIDVVSGLRTQGGASQHVGGANRTIIKLAQQLLIHPATRVADQPVGTLVKLDQVYDLISNNIASDIRGKIDSIPARTKHPLAQAVAKVVCLLQFVKVVHRSAENIAAALVDTVDADSKLPLVREALAELQTSLFVREGEDGYRIPTPSEDDWEKTRQAIEPRRGDRRQLLATTISEFWAPQPEFTLGESKVFKAGLLIDSVEKTAGDIPFLLQLSDDAAAAANDAEILRTRSQTERASVFWSVALDDEISREAGEAYRSDEIIKRKGREATTAEETKLIGEERARLRRHLQELQRRLRAACLSGRIYFQGNDRSPAPGSTDIKKVATGVLGQALPMVYDRFKEASAKRTDIAKGVTALLTDESLSGLPRVFTDLSLLKDEGGKRLFNLAGVPLSELMTHIEEKARFGEQATGKSLADAFNAAPFGWDFEAVKLLTLALLRAGAIDATHKGQTLESATSLAAQGCFENNPAYRLASFRPRKGVDAHVLAAAVDNFRDTFGNEAREIAEAPLAVEIRKEIEVREDDVASALTLLRTAGLPGTEVLDTALNDMRNIRRSGDGAAIVHFNAAHRSIADAVKRSADIARALNSEGQHQIQLARQAVVQLEDLSREPDLAPGFAEAGDSLNDLLSRETFFRDLADMERAAKLISVEEARRRAEALSARMAAYSDAVRKLAMMNGWEQLDPAVQESVARPLKACIAPVADFASIAQLRSETESCANRLATAVRQVMEAIEGDRLATVSVGQFFVGGIETEEQLDQALAGLRDELGRLIGEGKKVIVQ